jgi:hypothetical protein
VLPFSSPSSHSEELNTHMRNNVYCRMRRAHTRGAAVPQKVISLSPCAQ